MTDLTLAAAVAQLYADPPAGFVAARAALVQQARGAGDKELAQHIAGLRRPTQAAWLLNVLARQPGALDDLVDVGQRLREAQASLDGGAMKAVASERNTVIARVVEEAIGDQDASAATRDQLVATCTAAVADPAAEDALRSGQLVTALSYSGFGEVDLGDALATPLRLVTNTRPAPAPKRPTVNPRELRAAEKPVAATEREVAAATAALDAARDRLSRATQQHSAAEAALQTLTKGAD